LQKLKKSLANIEIAFSIDWKPKTLNLNRIQKSNSWLWNKVIDNFVLAKKILWRKNVSITMTVSTNVINLFWENLKFLFNLNPYLIRFRLAAGEVWSKNLIDIYLLSFKSSYIFYLNKLYIEKSTDNIPLVEQFEHLINIKDNSLWPCSKWINLTLTPDWFFVPCYNFLTKEKQDKHKFKIHIKDIFNNKNNLDAFMQWRMKYYSSNNGVVNNIWKTEISRSNFSTCIIWELQGAKKNKLINIWKYKEENEKKIWLLTFNLFYKKYGINLLKKSLTYNKK
jgi:hypothetical protein